MKLLAILGSPRRGGNTEALLDEAMRGARDAGAHAEKVVLRDLKISPCLEIYKCREEGVCAIADDMQELFLKLARAPRLVIASPIFFYSVSAVAKAMIDRCQSLWVKKYLLGMPVSEIEDRRGAFISVGATRGKRLFEGARLTVKYFFDSLDVAYADELFVRGVDEKGEIFDYPEALAAAFELGAGLVLDDRKRA